MAVNGLVFMLPRVNRLKNTKEIGLVFQRGRGIKRDFLFIKFIKNNLGASRFAFIVSQKVAKKAVRRNAIKRMLREIIRKRLPRIRTGFDFVFVAQEGIKNKKHHMIEKSVEELLSRYLEGPTS